jgi:heat shock protein HslJ
MSKPFAWLALAVVLLVGGFFALNAYIYDQKQGDGTEAPQAAPAGLTGGGWTWVRTELPGGMTVAAPEGGRFVLSFDEDGRMASTTDCNQMSGSYTTEGDTLIFGAIAMTKMYCEGSMEGTYAEQLDRTIAFSVENGELRLVFAEGAGMMVFMRDGASSATGPLEMVQ